jgi:hypothetical protein
MAATVIRYAGLPSLLLLLVLVVRDARAAWPHDPYDGGVALSTASADQTNPGAVSDGAGGAIVVWTDLRSGTNDIYVQRVTEAGVAVWTANGVALCTAANGQINPTIASDGAGGAIVAWSDSRGGVSDIYAQRVNAAGATQWLGDGVAICTAVGAQTIPTICADGAGGAIVAWADNRGGATADIWAQRVNAAGAVQWLANGVSLCTAGQDQTNPVIASDAANGAIVSWQDFRGASSFDVYAQRVSASGTPLWTVDGVVVWANTGNQQTPAIIADGAGGAVIAWADYASGSADIYAARLSAAGTSQWAGGPAGVCFATGDQLAPVLVSDGAGGAVIAWQDGRVAGSDDIYAQRVSGGGTALWTLNGVGVTTASGTQKPHAMASDGAGGAIIAFADIRPGMFSTDITAQRVTATGTVLWATNGVTVSAASNSQQSPVVVADNAGGAIVAWYDFRSFSSHDIYAQRLDRFGYLGNPEPVIASVRDVPNDQGGKVKLSWTASWLDPISDPSLTAYDVYRSAPGSLALTALQAGARRLASFADVPTPGERAFLVDPLSAQAYAWEYVVTVNPVHFIGTYAYIATTTGDSIGGSNPHTTFMVVGRNGSSSLYWLSAPDSGYSVDNIPPDAPSPFTSSALGGATRLHWDPNVEGDLAGYRLHRGTSAGFVPSLANLIASPSDTGYTDAGPAGSWYKLSAVDAHGNQSPFATVGPVTTVDAPPGGASAALLLAAPWPNPTSGGASFAFGLPGDGDVRLALFDQQGRRVRTLARGSWPAGEHRVTWDGRDESGREVASGLYFARLEHGGQRLIVRLMAIR